MSIRVMAYVWDHTPKMDPTGMLVLLVLADRADEDGVSWYAASTVARRCHISERQARRWIHSLSERGLVAITERPGRTNIVRIIMRTPDTGDTPVTHVHPPLTPMSGDTSSNPSSDPSALAAFDAAWQAYPRKQAKGAARKAWLAAAKKVPVETLLAALTAQSTYLAARHREGFCPYLSSWLNQERWNDEVAEVQRPNGSEGGKWR